MNRKAFSLLFSVLLASNFAFEIYSGIHREYLENSQQTKLVTRSKRAAKPIIFGLTVEATSDYLVVTNNTAQVGSLITPATDSFTLLNGNTGSGILIHVNNSSGIYISSGLWNASTASLKESADSVRSRLVNLAAEGKAERFSLKAVRSTILNEVTEILVDLVAFVEIELVKKPSSGLELAVSIVKHILELFEGNMDGTLEVIGDNSLELNNDISGLLNIFQGLSTILTAVNYTARQGVEDNIGLDLRPILSAKNGVVALTNAVSHLSGGNLDFRNLAKLLSNVDEFLLLIARLGGNVTFGVSGAIKTIGELAAYSKNKTTIEVVIGCLIQYVAYTAWYVDEDLNEELTESLTELVSALNSIDPSNLFDQPIDILTDLLGGALTVGQTNLSKIIEKLLTGIATERENLLKLVVEVQILMEPILPTAQSIPYLLLILICKLDSPGGIEQIEGLGIDVSLSAGEIVGGLLSGILSLVPNILTLLFGNLYNILKTIPRIDTITNYLTNATAEASNGSLSLEKLLEANPKVKGLIKGLFQLKTGLPLTSRQNVLAAKVVLEAVTALGAYVSVDITVKVNRSIFG